VAKAYDIRPEQSGRPIDRFLMPFNRFFQIEASGGILLLACTALALLWANSPWGEGYDRFWHTYVTVGFGEHALQLSLAHLVNDGLMAIFFFVVGLEIKRELLVGELASPRRAAVPIVAAVGGLAVPAIIYALCNLGGDGMSGWAIPTATDIAFAVGVLALLGDRVPLSLKVFVTAAAIVDDLAAVVVIALFYTEGISILALSVAGGFLLVAVCANLAGIRSALVYALIGVAMWLMLLQSGVHATVGGVLLAFTIPSRRIVHGRQFTAFAEHVIGIFRGGGSEADDVAPDPRSQAAVRGLEVACRGVLTPLDRLERDLHPWVAYAIMPIFALANAGVALRAGIGDAIGSGVGLGVILGLVLGKPLGIFLATAAAVRFGLGDLPAGTNWRQIAAGGCLAGIGFTMSLFIANLAFGEGGEMLYAAKVGILAASLVSGVVGMLLLRAASSAAQTEAEDTTI
jgi:NhaA family Na+:H+ antiporter